MKNTFKCTLSEKAELALAELSDHWNCMEAEVLERALLQTYALEVARRETARIRRSSQLSLSPPRITSSLDLEL